MLCIAQLKKTVWVGKIQRCGLARRLLFLFILQIDNIVLMKDSETGRSKGYGFITVSL